MTTEHTETSHTHTDDGTVESGTLLDTSVEETGAVDTGTAEAEQAATVETQETGGTEDTSFELPEEFADNPRFEGIDSEQALYARIAESGAPESYQLDGIDEGIAGAISESARAADMTQAQVEAMLNFSAEQNKAAEAAMWQEIQGGVDALQSEWGDEFEGKVKDANKAIRVFDDDGELRKLMQSNPVIANHPTVVRMFERIYRKIDVDRFLDSAGNPKTVPKDEHGNTYFSSYDKSMR